MRRTTAVGVVWCALALGARAAAAAGFTGPAEWRLVSTNAVRDWQAAQQARASETFRVWPGVAADLRAREVRLLAEAVGHDEGVTVEFLLVGPASDRAYESAAVTVARPGDIARAVEALGVARGGGVGSRRFRFWPCGERLAATARRLGGGDGAERPLQALLRDAAPDAPLVGAGGLVFAGGRWSGESCLTDTNLPCAVISLYNEPGTLFDVPFQVGQSDVYGRLKLGERLPHGALLEIVLRPLPPPDGKPRVLPLAAEARRAGAETRLTVKDAAGRAALADVPLDQALVWLRAQSEAGREIFLTLALDEAMPLGAAADVARVFGLLDGSGLKLDGVAEGGLFPRAFLPQERWRAREGRTPQPFELHVRRDGDGKLARTLVFIEEDWNVEGLDPKLTPREYPFDTWEELPALVARAGGQENKVALLFVFAPAELPLSAFMPGVRALAERLPLVYVFGE